MKNKPNTNEILEIVDMKKQAGELYDEIENRVAALKEKYGVARFDFDLEEFLDEYDGDSFDESIMENGRYLKFQITDNAEAMKNGTAIFAKAYVKPLAWEVRPLKRCPESLK